MKQELVVINGDTGDVMVVGENDRNDRGQFREGVSGYNHGMNANWKEPYRELLRRISMVELAKNKSLLEHYVERAYEDDGVLKDLMSKLLPTKKIVEGNGMTILAEEMSGELRRVLAVIQGGRKR